MFSEVNTAAHKLISCIMYDGTDQKTKWEVDRHRDQTQLGHP